MRYAPDRLRPVDDMVLIRMLKEDNITPGGVVIPDNVMQLGVQSVVAAIGSLVSDVIPGDHVIVEANLDVERSATFEYEGEEFWLIPEELIVARVEMPPSLADMDRRALPII